jgi:hypothetical protein
MNAVERGDKSKRKSFCVFNLFADYFYFLKMVDQHQEQLELESRERNKRARSDLEVMNSQREEAMG